MNYLWDWLPTEGTKPVLLNYYQAAVQWLSELLCVLAQNQHVYYICQIICGCPKVSCLDFKFVVFCLKDHSILSAEEIRLT